MLVIIEAGQDMSKVETKIIPIRGPTVVAILEGIYLIDLDEETFNLDNPGIIISYNKFRPG
jgi:hypothetical protein